MHTCKTCGWWEEEPTGLGLCHHVSNNTNERVSQPRGWYCPFHTDYQRERDRMEIAKAAMGGLLANTEFRGGYHVHVEAAMMYADALLSALEEQ